MCKRVSEIGGVLEPKRGAKKMGNEPVDLVDGWLEHKQDELILCPHQPGQLRLTIAACVKRHLAAHAKPNNLGWLRTRPVYDRVKTGLSVCRQCAIGEQLSRSGSSVRMMPFEDRRTKKVVILQEEPNADI
jgi:hypothetical protein